MSDSRWTLTVNGVADVFVTRSGIVASRPPTVNENGSGGTTDNVCDPRGGFSLTQNSIDNFSKIVLQRGKRVIEFALKLYF